MTQFDEFLKATHFTRHELYLLTDKFHSLLQAQTNASGSSYLGNSSASYQAHHQQQQQQQQPSQTLATHQHQQHSDKLDRSKFRDLLADAFGIDDSLIMDRIFRCFDFDADNFMSIEEFVKGMNIFLKGKYDDHLKFCFKVYDLNGDRYISKEEMFQLLKTCLVKGTEEDDDGVKDLVDLIMKKLDEDRDGRVSENDWSNSVGKDHLLLEAFGQCLPSNECKKKFLFYTDSDVKVWEEKYKTRPTPIKKKLSSSDRSRPQSSAVPEAATNAKQRQSSPAQKKTVKAVVA